MSDTINTLNRIVHTAGARQKAGDGANEEEFAGNLKLLEDIAEIAGDCLEDHVKATRPRKERVYRQIVKEIAVHFCDVCDNPEQACDIEMLVREILASYDVETTDYTDRKVKIS